MARCCGSESLFIARSTAFPITASPGSAFVSKFPPSWTGLPALMVLVFLSASYSASQAATLENSEASPVAAHRNARRPAGRALRKPSVRAPGENPPQAPTANGHVKAVRSAGGDNTNRVIADEVQAGLRAQLHMRWKNKCHGRTCGHPGMGAVHHRCHKQETAR